MRNFVRLLKGAGILNVLGMTVAFAAIYIILVQINYDWNYNNQIKDVDRIFVAAHKDWQDEKKYDINFCRPIMETLMKQSSVVESYTVVNSINNQSFVIGQAENERTVVAKMMNATSTVFDLFGIEVIAGTLDGIGQEYTLAINENTAKRLSIKLGDVLQLEEEGVQRTVIAVFEDMPRRSMIAGVDFICCNILEEKHLDDFGQYSYRYFVKLRHADDMLNFEENAEIMIRRMVDSDFVNFTEQEKDEYVTSAAVTLFALKGSQFKKELIDTEPLYKCNKTTTITLLVVAILILAITLINYLNFFMAQVPLKLKAVNTRKILGDSRASLVAGFMLESVMLVTISLLLSYVLVRVMASSTYAELISCPLGVSSNVSIALFTVGIVLAVTLATTLYPALYVTSFSPAIAIKGTMGTVNKGKMFRYILIGFQFTISIVFVISAFFIRMQYDYMMNYDMGFDKELLYTATIPADVDNRDSYTSEFQNQTAIRDVTWASTELVGLNKMGWRRPVNGKTMSFSCYPVSYNFLQFMGIEVLEGRDFLPADEKCENGIFIFNQAAKEKFELELTSKVHGHITDTDIAGFCEDFITQPLHYEMEPFAFYVFGKHPWWPLTHLYIRSNPGATYEDIRKAVEEVVMKLSPDFNLEKINLKFFNEELGLEYAKERRVLNMITLFTALAIVISLIGIVGLLMYETKFRRKEIGLRRVHGASITEILSLFNRIFFYIFLVSFLIAAPLSYIVMDYYYSSFAYHLPLYWWVFLIAFVLVAVVMFTVVTLCCYKAASENPSKTLKNE